MNRLNIQQTGGFPLTTNTLDFLQSSLLLMQNFGEIAGNLAIISGCVVNGTQVTSGTVYINGEILHFEGGTIGTNVIIKENTIEKQFEDGTAKPVEIYRQAMFGNGSTTYAWNNFTRLKPLKALQRAVTPVGLISMWSGSTEAIPEGWHLCNGENGTPDLRGRFVLGSNGSDLGETGGADKITLQEINLPPHKHSVKLTNSHSHRTKDAYYVENAGVNAGLDGAEPIGNNKFGSADSDWDNNYLYYKNRYTENAEITLSGDTGYTGGMNNAAQPFDNRPAYYTLAFIMFKG